ncbi:HlyD family efflux transporter periplasmic adaptor subunit [Aporhodopirellula aestuarii]|uniref:HlyD family efflux transporter periplasmic adaptor subunit n=1 Tax=Aporhodopirellula aestuarii TaxID=2950107 RepID=A0ABT0U4J2_9BACT|nr:HlyD family efflux transporter periplasmic adaptor subunit [Aporhodopirellula aestuarii]MCM2371823.1 HlyD family efflux transporter periplasmic adaptor subunit [Aporhodopirellula aestuarii]
MKSPILFAVLAFAIPLSSLHGSDDSVVEVRDVVVEFAGKIDVPARQSGPVAELKARQNQWVTQGQTIAKLDDTALVIRRRAASLRYDSARLVLQDRVEIQYAETALAEAQAELDDGQAASDRVSGAVARNQLRRMKLATERAELELARAEKQWRQAEIDMQLRAADLAMIDHELQQLECTSPIDGIVLDVYRELGEWIHAGDPLVTIADAGVLHLHALVDADQLDPARCVGLSVTVHWSNESRKPHVSSSASTAQGTGSLRGQVISVDPTRLPGNRFRLHAEVENRRHIAGTVDAQKPGMVGDGWQLSPGMEVMMKIHCSDAEIAWRKNRSVSGSLR